MCDGKDLDEKQERERETRERGAQENLARKEYRDEANDQFFKVHSLIEALEEPAVVEMQRAAGEQEPDEQPFKSR